jgi:hypothetical protein
MAPIKTGLFVAGHVIVNAINEYSSHVQIVGQEILTRTTQTRIGYCEPLSFGVLISREGEYRVFCQDLQVTWEALGELLQAHDPNLIVSFMQSILTLHQEYPHVRKKPDRRGDRKKLSNPAAPSTRQVFDP